MFSFSKGLFRGLSPSCEFVLVSFVLSGTDIALFHHSTPKVRSNIAVIVM